jgi:hypothetical protein
MLARSAQRRFARGFRTVPWRFVGAVVVGLLATEASAAAQTVDPAPSADRLRSAANEYDAGRRAYVAKDYESAATHFENAFHDAPRAEALRNAIRARRAAKQFARAATLAALGQSRYPNDAATQALARETLEEAAPKLYDVVVVCQPDCELAADGRVVSLEDAPRIRLFLDPGRHVLTASFPGSSAAEVSVQAVAGASGEFTLTAPPKPPEERDADGVPRAGVGSVEAPRRKPLPRVVFYGAVALTGVLGGLTVASAIDTVNNPGADRVREECRGLGPECPAYQDGRERQLRTNILLGATAGVAVVTAVTGIFFTDWSKPSSTQRAAPRTTVQHTAVQAVLHGGMGGGYVGLAGSF